MISCKLFTSKHTTPSEREPRRRRDLPRSSCWEVHLLSNPAIPEEQSWSSSCPKWSPPYPCPRAAETQYEAPLSDPPLSLWAIKGNISSKLTPLPISAMEKEKERRYWKGIYETCGREWRCDVEAFLTARLHVMDGYNENRRVMLGC